MEFQSDPACLLLLSNANPLGEKLGKTNKRLRQRLRVMDNKGQKRNVAQEVDGTFSYCGNSPEKKKSNSGITTLALKSSDLFDTVLAGANREVNMLFSKYSEVLSERAAVDAAQVRELEDLLLKARNLESQLRDKKDRLRRTLALISDKLQG
ncbi:hypothetical protein UPYG_G00198310 [Umbra pygmaea]|uniref:Uncharacterized protein n=1 Tax=Umbra pygmaea TaxID=75934 RepID=A0ABD0WZT6_UMBPY